MQIQRGRRARGRPSGGNHSQLGDRHRGELEREEGSTDVLPNSDPGRRTARRTRPIGWCATITDAQGPSFIPFTSFYHKCWNVGTTMSPGTQFKPEQNPIDAVVFLVPGRRSDEARPSTSRSSGSPQAPARSTRRAALRLAARIRGRRSTTASDGGVLRRAAVTGTDCKKYIVQNNNWGNPTGSTQVINYTGNRLHCREQQRFRQQCASVVPVHLRRRERQRRERHLQHLVRHGTAEADQRDAKRDDLVWLVRRQWQRPVQRDLRRVVRKNAAHGRVLRGRDLRLHHGLAPSAQ